MNIFKIIIEDDFKVYSNTIDSTFYITNNKDDDFDYYIYTNTDLYYSFNSNKDLNDSIFIDYNGDKKYEGKEE